MAPSACMCREDICRFAEIESVYTCLEPWTRVGLFAYKALVLVNYVGVGLVMFKQYS